MQILKIGTDFQIYVQPSTAEVNLEVDGTIGTGTGCTGLQSKY